MEDKRRRLVEQPSCSFPRNESEWWPRLSRKISSQNVSLFIDLNVCPFLKQSYHTASGNLEYTAQVVWTTFNTLVIFKTQDYFFWTLVTKIKPKRLTSVVLTLGSFHKHIWCAPWFVWVMWTRFYELGCTPANSSPKTNKQKTFLKMSSVFHRKIILYRFCEGWVNDRILN